MIYGNGKIRIVPVGTVARLPSPSCIGGEGSLPGVYCKGFNGLSGSWRERLVINRYIFQLTG